jgi:cyclopropane fatty-acyl-phospholipid synthase-like methyltransferase
VTPHDAASVSLTGAEERDQAQPDTMWNWYRRYYSAAPGSQAHGALCERLYGRDLCQHGFADMQQVGRLLGVLHLRPGSPVLELGCGSGGIAEYISDLTGAHVTGLDNSPEAIALAEQRALPKADRLRFVLGSMDHMEFPVAAFDAIIAIDALYFTDLDRTVAQMQTVLKPDGEMGILYSHGADPQVPIAVFPRQTLPPDKTPLAQALQRHRLTYQTWDLTQDDYQHAQRKKAIAEQLRPQFEAEGNLFLYENRHGEAEGVMAATEAGAHRRYLYRCHYVPPRA